MSTKMLVKYQLPDFVWEKYLTSFTLNKSLYNFYLRYNNIIIKKNYVDIDLLFKSYSSGI